MPEQVAAVKDALQQGLTSAEAITAGYKNPKTTLPKVQEALSAMLMLGYVNQDNEQYRLVG